MGLRVGAQGATEGGDGLRAPSQVLMPSMLCGAPRGTVSCGVAS